MGGVEQWHLMSEKIDDNQYRICAPPEYFCGVEDHLTESGEHSGVRICEYSYLISLLAQGVTWNLGCIFAEMLSNKPLFTSRTRNGMCMAPSHPINERRVYIDIKLKLS